jgi:hypothetical protein
VKQNRLTVAFRAYVERRERDARESHARGAGKKWPRFALILDTETTTDASQRLTFGSYRFCRVGKGGRLQCVEEGLFYADDLPKEDPAGFEVLRTYAASSVADVVAGVSRTLRFHSRREFLDSVFRQALDARAMIVGFNLPFDLSRLACGWGEARGHFRGGFSLPLWEFRDAKSGEWREHPYRPRIAVKPLDSKRAFLGLRKARRSEQDKERSAGRFLDPRTLGFALTNEAYSLARGCEAFAVEHGKGRVERHGTITPEYIDYCQRDVLATAELFEKLAEEFNRHPVRLDPCKAYSPAAVAKAYLREMGIVPPSVKFADVPKEILGYAMSAYYGGRAECRIRRRCVPVVYVDFLSMYPTVNSLMELWDLLTAERVEIRDATDEIRSQVATLTPEQCMQPEFWPGLRWFARIRPSGDTLPVRARYNPASDGLNIGVNYFHSVETVWYAGPDIVASTILSGRAPEIIEAFRMVPVGRQAGLQPVTLRGAIPIDPTGEDFFRSVIEQRVRVKNSAEMPASERDRLSTFLKVLANSGSYGIFAEMNRIELRKDEKAPVSVFGTGGKFDAETNAPEEIGEFFFALIAALIPAAARLMLALLEHFVTAAGGSYAFCDTDSMAIVANRYGGLVECDGGPGITPEGRQAICALSYVAVREIVTKFSQLNPYDRNAVRGSIVKVEDVNFVAGEQREIHCFAISAKRYALFRFVAPDRIEIVDAKEHGLGHLLNPIDHESADRDWIPQVWEWIICRELGLPATDPVWFDRPAISRMSFSSPELLAPVAREGVPYSEDIKPANFLLSAHVAPFGHPPVMDPKHFHLIAPFEADPRKWTEMPWTDIYSDREYGITTNPIFAPGLVRVKSYRDVIESYRYRPEYKSNASGGSPCTRTTVGLLERRVIVAGDVIHVGKESNRLGDVEAGLLHDWADIISSYENPERWKSEIVPRLRVFPRNVLAQELGISPRQVSALLNGHAQPSLRTRKAVARLLARLSGTDYEGQAA